MKAYDKTKGKSSFKIYFDGKGAIPKKIRRVFKKAARQESKRQVKTLIENC